MLSSPNFTIPPHVDHSGRWGSADESPLRLLARHRRDEPRLLDLDRRWPEARAATTASASLTEVEIVRACGEEWGEQCVATASAAVAAIVMSS